VGALPEFQNSDRTNNKDPRSHDAPAKNWQAEPSASSGAFRPDGGDRFRGRQSQRNNLAAITAVGQVLQHVVPLVAGQRLLGECSQQIGIGMRLCRHRHGPLQPGSHDFGDVLHFSF
jgi:hypothetical protein